MIRELILIDPHAHNENPDNPNNILTERELGENYIITDAVVPYPANFPEELKEVSDYVIVARVEWDENEHPLYTVISSIIGKTLFVSPKQLVEDNPMIVVEIVRTLVEKEVLLEYSRNTFNLEVEGLGLDEKTVNTAINNAVKREFVKFKKWFERFVSENCVGEMKELKQAGREQPVKPRLKEHRPAKRDKLLDS